MRHLLIALSLLLCPVTAVYAQINFDFGSPGIIIGINVPVYPSLVRVPGYPVFYDPRANSNYFFYDGLYWVFLEDNWYSSDWYNGPWRTVEPAYIPLWVLRVPVRYYRHAPTYFGGWRADAPPRWGDHWGNNWVQQRSGWDRWDRRSAPAAAPLPQYQRQYSGDRYPRAVQQQVTIRSQNYRYQPRDKVAQQHFQQSGTLVTPGTQPSQQARTQQQPQPQREQQSAARPVQRTQPAERAQPAQHAQPGQPAERAVPAQPANPAQRAQPTQSQRPHQQEQRKAAPVQGKGQEDKGSSRDKGKDNKD